MGCNQIEPVTTYPVSNELDGFPAISSEESHKIQVILDATVIQPVSAVYWVSTPRWNVGERVMRDSMWYYIESGTVGGYVGDSTNPVTLRAGDLFLLPRGVPQSNWSMSKSDIRIYTVHFYADAYGALDLLTLFGVQGKFSGKPGGLFERATKMMTRCFEHKPVGWRQGMQNAVWDVLLNVLRQHLATTEGELQFSKSLLRLVPAFRFLDEHLHESSISVSDLAESVHVSEVYLRKLFRQAMSESPVAYIRRRRLERACMLLKTTDLPVKGVAMRCGFNNLPFFHNVFRDTFAMTPVQYRERGEFAE